MTDLVNAAQHTNVETFTATTNPYIVGPTIECRLPAGLSIEFDALLRHYRYQTTWAHVTQFYKTNVSTTAWEFPLLLKYRLPVGHARIRPYVDGGVSWDHLQGLSTTTFYATGLNLENTTITHSSDSPELTHRSSTGIVIGGGIEIRAPFLRIAPEVRYTRWMSQHFNYYTYLGSNQNQTEFLLGITFGRRP